MKNRISRAAENVLGNHRMDGIFKTAFKRHTLFHIHELTETETLAYIKNNGLASHISLNFKPTWNQSNPVFLGQDICFLGAHAGKNYTFSWRLLKLRNSNKTEHKKYVIIFLNCQSPWK